MLADDPSLFAAGGQSGDFHILYSRLAKDRLLLADERIVTSRLLKDHPHGLFVFSDRTQTNWHFLNVQMEEEEEKRKLYRRVTVGPKLTKLKAVLKKMPLREGKRFLFTQYADTAAYLYENLNSGDQQDEIDVIYSSDKSKARIVGRFAPKANPEYKFQAGESELKTLVATDVLAEGLNLQDCNKIINYDLHWNPVRLIQRFGRIDRIGSDHEFVHGFNFLPEVGIESNLGLRQRLRNRIQEIHDTIGEDSAILDRTEQLNEEAMYAIYDKKSLGSEALEDEEGDFLDLNEAEDILRQLKSDNPAEYERSQIYVMASEPRNHQIRRACSCSVKQDGINNCSCWTKRARSFQETCPKCSGQSSAAPISRDTLGQRYVIRELSVLFRASEDEDQNGQITLLEKAFRSPLTKALQRERNLLRRNGPAGEALLKNLARLYQQHNLRDWLDRRTGRPEEDSYPRIICSEGLA